jgi:hypothetical protein
MKHDSRITALLFEMIGSAAICGVVFVADLVVGAQRRRAARL